MPPGGGGADAQLHPVLGHGPPGQGDALLFQQLAEDLVAEGMGGVLVLQVQQQPLLWVVQSDHLKKKKDMTRTTVQQ